jgi:hypothetical protein
MIRRHLEVDDMTDRSPVVVDGGGSGNTAIVALVVVLLLVVVGWWFLLGPGAGTQSGGDTNIDVNLPSAPVVQPT